ncbi:DUF2125 domain-containing protein [Pikeienuella sp. HZG-20]|uniref:DUF2125 domain-containing protein n=1 Tax=Paludibacillus litoralis TaxID=3133267 RepID=UPI0030EBFF04
MKFKLLAGAVIAVIVGVSVWWLLAARAQEAALAGWLAERRAAGWQAEAADVSILGFPNRLDLKLTEPALADPASGWAWSAPWFEVAHLIYQPSLFIGIWPPEQRLAAPGGRAVLRTETMKASFRTETSAALPLVRASLDIERGALAADAGWTAGAARISAHVRAAPDAGPENAYEFRADGLRLRLPNHIRALLDPTDTLPPAIETVTLEGRAAFDRPLDRFALEGPKPGLRLLSLDAADAEWGRLKLTVSGSMKADAEGYGEGEFAIGATNWTAMLDAAAASGALSAPFVETLKTGLGFVARLTGDGETLNVSLSLSGGYARIGPVPIGRAPRLID